MTVFFLRFFTIAGLVLSFFRPVEAASPASSELRHRVYTHLMNPREHPDDNRRHIRPPDWASMGDRVHFVILRGFEIQNGQLQGYREEIEKYHRTFDLGDVVWPNYETIFAPNLGELAEEIRSCHLYLFDIWGYVPGSGPGGYWQQFQPPAGVFDLLESKLGERWLGMDVGEQDGRYIGSYAGQLFPAQGGRWEQYLGFHRHFEKMTQELGNKMATLVSLNFGHYFLKEGLYTLIGAETAQGLPNSQVYYVFIRGAGKQYGVPWFGNASVFNRWGWKSYDSEGDDHGPTHGTSLSLLKRLLYTHILYNSMVVGFEAGWVHKGELTPLGRIQQAAHRWTQIHGQPGVMQTPIALMLGFHSGWSFPRHLYSQNLCRVWGNLPYEAGDYLTDGVLDLLYPGYQDSSYFHDESGFLTATPYGDSADALLSDAPGWLLARYPMLIVTGDLGGGSEICDKLEAYVKDGGQLCLTAGNLAQWPGGLGQARVAGAPVLCPAGQAMEMAGQKIKENGSFEIIPLALPPGARVLARAGKHPLVAEIPCGEGSITLFATPFGLPRDQALTGPIKSEIDKTLARPFPLLNHVRFFFDNLMREQALFEVGENLSLIVCRKSSGEYTLGILNNGWQERPFKVVSHCGPIKAIEELPLDQSEKSAVGYLPRNLDVHPGPGSSQSIAGGDVRIFSVRVQEQKVAELPHLVPPPRPRGRWLRLDVKRSLQEEILRRPTFFEHFDGVLIDWRYVQSREPEELRREAGWIRRQQLRVAVDLSSGINLYPDLRLLNNLESEYAASMTVIDGIMVKMGALGARDLVLSLHRFPENNFTEEQSWDSFEQTLRRLCQQGEKCGLLLHLRLAPAKPPRNLAEALRFIDKVGAKNLRLAPSVALAGSQEGQIPADKLGMWLISGTASDITGTVWNWNAPVAASEQGRQLSPLLSAGPEVPLVLDATYINQEAEYHDIKVLEQLATARAR